MSELLRRGDVLRDHPDPCSWQRVIYSEFESTLLSSTRAFPCLFGTAGLKADQLRFSFQETLEGPALASALEVYLADARTYGPNTSLVIFERPLSRVETLDAYANRFWQLLRAIAKEDTAPWPIGIPTQLDDPAWEFCFAGEPVFVVSNTPAHVMRQSRRSSTFTLTFQPRWVFESILGTEEAAALSIDAVSKRLNGFDLVAKCPSLGRYGNNAVREWKQYFLPDENVEISQPFQSLLGDNA